MQIENQPAPSPSGAAQEVTVSRLRCELLDNPLGIDTSAPRLSWQLVSGRRGCRQTAYQVLVSTTKKALARGDGDLWDSGKVFTEKSVHVRYRGVPLASRTRCFWKVRVWDEKEVRSPWSGPALWSMGLLSEDDWKAKWIGLPRKTAEEKDKAAEEMDLSACQWIWFPKGRPKQSAPVGSCLFRADLLIPGSRKITSASWLGAADNGYTLYINGKKAGSGNSFKAANYCDLLPFVVTGKNAIAVEAVNVGDGDNPAGLIGMIKVAFEKGEPFVLRTSSAWKAAETKTEQWNTASLAAGVWKDALELGPAGTQPWGEVSTKHPDDRRLPARMLRREFVLEKKVKGASAYVCGLGLFELYLNGAKVGDRVLDPALTEYTKRAFYVTFDVTDRLAKGENAIGVVLGNGRYYAPRLVIPTQTRTFGFPKLLLQLHVEYSDGSTDTFVSDENWKLTADGPIRTNNEYDGEIYDARLEQRGWCRTGFDDSAWQAVEIVDGVEGELKAQMCAPIKVVETLEPVSVSNPRPGVYIFDMGQNMVGWPRLKVKGPEGTEVTMSCAEVLRDNGLLYTDNLRSAKARDIYILKGEGVEVYEPRFTYHGFRYVALTGYPGTPDREAITGCVVHDALKRAGSFSCSNALLNRIYRNILWGVKGNYRSIPTDCPQRDEKQGWLGDRSIESLGESYLFDVAALYRKWLGDIRDGQRESGSVPDVCPPYWPFYTDNVTWPSSCVIIPGHLYRQYGDRGIIERHYPVMKKWIDYMCGFLKDGIMPRDQYGDWCVPPDSKEVIHAQDPAKKTRKEILGTAYFYYDLTLMAQYAALLGKHADKDRFLQLARTLKDALNREYFNSEENRYDNGSQTSSVLPLAFGLVPEGHEKKVFANLVEKIVQEGDRHIGTGLIGAQWLMRVLSDRGRADLAYTIATQTTYPSWGYMIENGATTIWELWNGNTANPAMNSRNHVMLVGDLNIWLHEYLAGIRPDPSAPGFEKIIIRPVVAGDLAYVEAAYDSIRGTIKSSWCIEADGTFTLKTTVPANCTAAIYVPAAEPGTVTESGVKADQADNVSFLRMESGYAVFSIGSGSYIFVSDYHDL